MLASPTLTREKIGRNINQEISFILKSTVRRLTSDNDSYEFIPSNDTPLPSVKRLKEIVELIRVLVFPGFYGSSVLREATIPFSTGGNLEKLFELLYEQVYNVLNYVYSSNSHQKHHDEAVTITLEFIKQLPEIRRVLGTDVKATFDGDPAAKNFGEIIYAYPTIRALINYRIAHQLHVLGVPLLPRIITEQAHSETGIDIHPGAQIGECFCIDHGTGVVIGETCIIGNSVKLFQGVTLGAKSFKLDDNGNPHKDDPRHPIIEDNVTIYSNASVLGRITIGSNSIIGGNIWLTKSVAPNSKIIQKGTENRFNDGLGI